MNIKIYCAKANSVWHLNGLRKTRWLYSTG